MCVTQQLVRKQGVTIPILNWNTPRIIEAWRDDCGERIQSVFSKTAAQRLMRHQRTPAAEHSLYAVMMLTFWMRQYRVSI